MLPRPVESARFTSHEIHDEWTVMSTTTQHALRIAKITELSDQVFANPEKSKRWLHQPLTILDGQSPISMLDSEEGARIVENLLGQLDEGYFT